MRCRVTVGVIVTIVLVVFGSVIAQPVARHDSGTEWLAGSTPIRKGKSFGGSAQFAQAPPPSNRCMTPNFYCFLSQYVPVGTPCWCATPYGPVGGVVR